MQTILEFEGNTRDFEDALRYTDDGKTILDNIVYELNYGEGNTVHHTPYGDIKIRFM